MLIAAGSRLLRLENEKANLHHWQGREITVEAESPQKVWTECYRCPKFPNCDEIALIYQQELEVASD